MRVIPVYLVSEDVVEQVIKDERPDDLVAAPYYPGLRDPIAHHSRVFRSEGIGFAVRRADRAAAWRADRLTGARLCVLFTAAGVPGFIGRTTGEDGETAVYTPLGLELRWLRCE